MDMFSEKISPGKNLLVGFQPVSYTHLLHRPLSRNGTGEQNSP